MPIHKFITKRNLPLPFRPLPDSVSWKRKQVRYGPVRQGLRWEIFAQRTVKIEPQTSIKLELGFGVKMTKGKSIVSLRNKIIDKGCVLEDGTILEDVEDIIITIQNNSDSTVIIREGDSLCFIYYYVN